MRLIGTIARRTLLITALAGVALAIAVDGSQDRERDDDRRDGRWIFRFDTFGDEQLWTDVLKMHEVVARLGPATALSVGLKVDVDALPQPMIAALKAGTVDLADPAVTLQLLRADAVLGVKGTVREGRLARVATHRSMIRSRPGLAGVRTAGPTST
jgi:hypothetical protein